MLGLLRRCLCLMTIAAAPGLAASLCVTDTLSNYEALGSGGCLIGGLTVKDFAYTFVSGVNTIPDTGITVTPTIGPNWLALTFSSPNFFVSGTNSAKYVLAYTWDPGDIRSLEDILNANSPVFPGLAQITTAACRDAAFSGAVCSTTIDTIVVSDDGNTLNSPASVTFSPSIGTLGIRNTIELDANGKSSQFNSFENQIFLPEPATAAPCLLMGLLLLRRLRLKHR